jgi:hypothetical protein
MGSSRSVISTVWIFCSLALLGACLWGCSSARTNIFARDNGTFLVIASSPDLQKAKRAAVDAAEQYCKKLGKRVISEIGGDPYLQEEQASNQRKPDTVFTHDKRDNDSDTSVRADDNPDTENSAVARVRMDFRCI